MLSTVWVNEKIIVKDVPTCHNWFLFQLGTENKLQLKRTSAELLLLWKLGVAAHLRDSAARRVCVHDGAWGSMNSIWMLSDFISMCIYVALNQRSTRCVDLLMGTKPNTSKTRVICVLKFADRCFSTGDQLPFKTCCWSLQDVWNVCMLRGGG